MLNWVKSVLGVTPAYASRPWGAVDYHHYIVYEGVENPKKIDDSLFVSAYNEIYKNRSSCGLWTRNDTVPKELAAHELPATKHYMQCKERYWNMHQDLVLDQGDTSTYSLRDLGVFRNMQLRTEYSTDF
jgi:hypothetical protein